MGFVSGRNNSEDGLHIPLRAMPRAPGGLDISADEAVALPALFVDGLVIFLLGSITGTAYQILAFNMLGDPSIYAGTAFLVAVIFCGTTRLLGGARPMNASRGIGRARSALTTWAATFLFLMVVAFSLRIGTIFSRGAVFSFFLIGAPIIVATRVLVPRALARTRYANAYRGSEVIIVAPQGHPVLGPISSDLRARGCAGVHVIEYHGSCADGVWPEERERLVSRILETARVSGPGEIYVLSASVAEDRISSVLSCLRLVPRAVYLVPPEALSNLLILPVKRLGPVIAIETQRVPMSVFARTIKRSIDLVVSVSGLIVLAPALGLITLAVKLDSRGPALFYQRRNGYQGREFRIVKFRTMTVLEDGDAVTQVRRGDRRVTRVGRWLRKTSFDELPQLINILRGEMSLVGPRPHAVAHDELYSKLVENYELRQHVKPGVTGWAQVNGLRGETPSVDIMLRRIDFDLWYAANSSLTLDLQILLRTLLTVLRQDNAY
jgi:Undecaprenyl-phosphate glucose phosphotransferase